MTIIEIDKHAKILWNYMHMNHKLEKADLIMVLGSIDIRVAYYGADLFLEGYSDKILFSGGIAHQSDLLKTTWENSEADQFAEVAIAKGVPESSIYKEGRAENTGQNIKYAFELIKNENWNIKRIILVQKPYMERRTYATFMKQWPGDEIEIMITSPQLDFDEYFNEQIDKETTINLMVGDLQRIKDYPAKGFQIYQEIPEIVLESYNKLIEAGYVKHLIKD
jgi:uncharacterized SAM-binding protein YcdF (DUF218 family)